MSNPITVTLSGTWSEKARPNNGMERVAEYMNTHRLVRVPIVGYAEWYTHGESRTGQKMAITIPAIEPGMDFDGSDPEGIGAQLWSILDQLRRRAKLGAVEDTLFSMPSETLRAADDDEDGEMDGQLPLVDVPETRLTGDGPRVVPPASGEELTAELDERRAQTGPTRAEQETGLVGAANRAKESVVKATAKLAERDANADAADKVPAATFTAPGGDQ